MGHLIRGRALVVAGAEAELLWTDQPLSFWGGYDQRTGEIIDRRHPLSGRPAAGKVLALPYTRGSSTTTAVLLEAVRLGKAPAAIVTTAADSFTALASIVADELYGKPFPVVAIDRRAFRRLRSAGRVAVHRDGAVELDPGPLANPPLERD